MGRPQRMVIFLHGKMLPVRDLSFETLSVIESATIRADMIDFWQRNTEAGAAIGAQAGDPLSHYEALLADHEKAMAEGKAWLCVMRDADSGDLLGFAWWALGVPEGQPEHIATIKRLQLHPERQGEGLGKALLDYLHSESVLNRLGDQVDFLHLQFRAGRGLGRLYAKYGYEMNLRWDMIRKNEAGEYDGWIEMIRRRDGQPMPEVRW